jgi:hypothetical protein
MSDRNLAGTEAARGYVNTAGSPYSIDITMSDQTVNALSAGRYRLFLFKAVESAVGGGAPTVWAATGRYSASTKINWTEQYYAYASMEEVQNGVNFYGSDTEQIDLGQILEVHANALVSVANGGTPIGITASNTTTTQFSCGLAQPSPLAGGQPSPICAFPLYGRNQDLMVPLQKVALVFAAAPYQQGTVIESSIGPAVLADLTTHNSVSLEYDVNRGWSWSGNVASDIPPDKFVQTLIVPTMASTADAESALGADPVRSVSIWTPSRANPLRPLNMIASGPGGHTDNRTLAARLTPVTGAPAIAKDSLYLASYRTEDDRTELWQVKCTFVPGAPDVPYDFQKIQRADS